jgi:CRISPR/Cas system Type II protein with McrA/HNH and RuvC-like nuclease domain
MNAKKTKNMFMSCYQDAGQNISIKTANISLKKAKFKYLGTTITNQNYDYDEVKR